jgi:hypothetical protein
MVNESLLGQGEIEAARNRYKDNNAGSCQFYQHGFNHMTTGWFCAFGKEISLHKKDRCCRIANSLKIIKEALLCQPATRNLFGISFLTLT